MYFANIKTLQVRYDVSLHPLSNGQLNFPLPIILFLDSDLFVLFTE